MSKRLTVAVVIPVYNDAGPLRTSLEAIAQQTIMPDEVIVVDNNSTDHPERVVADYPFAKLIHESKQGVVHARNTGFNAVKSDIIGRIDADTILAPDWVATVRRIFITSGVDAVTGSVQYHDVLFSDTWAAVDLLIRRWLAFSLGPEVAIQGANMAVRRTAWKAVRSELCMQGGLHEDFDIGLHLYRLGFTIRFVETMVASVQIRQAGNSWRDFTSYVMMSPHTYALHQRPSRVYMYPVVGLAIAFYPLLFFTYRGYDAELERFSLRKLLGSSEARVNPATFVD